MEGVAACPYLGRAICAGRVGQIGSGGMLDDVDKFGGWDQLDTDIDTPAPHEESWTIILLHPVVNLAVEQSFVMELWPLPPWGPTPCVFSGLLFLKVSQCTIR